MPDEESYNPCWSTRQTLIQVNFSHFSSKALASNLTFTGSIDPNIENISANVNRAERSQNSANSGNFNYSSDESNDSLVIDQDN